MVMIVCPMYILCVITLLHRFGFQCGKCERLNTYALHVRVLGSRHGPGMDMFSVNNLALNIAGCGHFNVVPSR